MIVIVNLLKDAAERLRKIAARCECKGNYDLQAKYQNIAGEIETFVEELR